MPGNHKNHGDINKLNLKQGLISRDILNRILKTFNYEYINENKSDVINTINTEMVCRNELPIYSMSKLNGWVSNKKYKNNRILKRACIVSYNLKKELLKADQLKAEYVKAELLKAEQVKAELLKAEQVKAEQLKNELLKARLLKAEQLKAARCYDLIDIDYDLSDISYDLIVVNYDLIDEIIKSKELQGILPLF